jgi:hypothetical protein
MDAAAAGSLFLNSDKCLLGVFEPNSAERVRSPPADDDQSDQSDQSNLSVALFIFSALAPLFSFLENQQKQRERGHREITDPTDLTDSPVVMAAHLGSHLGWSIDPHHSAVLDTQIKINCIRWRVNLFCYPYTRTRDFPQFMVW